MNFKLTKSTISNFILLLAVVISLNSCGDKNKSEHGKSVTTTYANDVIPFFQHWNLILGDGSNVGQAIEFENKDFFYSQSDWEGDWVVFKAPNAGDTHGTSNNIRTELAQLKKWSPMSEAKMTASLKVMNVSATGDSRVSATHSVVVGQIHSADGHENEPLKIFYKKFPGHEKGSVFWHYEINTAGDDNSGRWDYSYPVWGYNFSVVGTDENTYPPEPKDGIALGEEFSYEVAVKDGIMNLTFTSEGHDTKTFSKNLVVSEYAEPSDMPEQVKKLFVPIGQDGVERTTAYADEGLFFKLGSYNQTNGKDPKINKLWCSGAETHGGDLEKQYATSNYAEVWFKSATIEIPDDAISNSGYFEANDGLSKKAATPHDVIPFMDKWKILLGDGTHSDDLVGFEKKDFFYVENDGKTNWVVYKTPNSGITSRTSSNTRTELGEKAHWIPEKGGKLTGTLKVQHVSTTGDARISSSFSTVIGQIHSDEGHENEPLKIYYKKFPGHTKGSVFWNYEINTKGDNIGRFDYSTAVWGHDFSVVGSNPTTYPKEPEDGIALGEEFSYEVNVHKGIMYLTFTSENHQTIHFKKSLIKSEFASRSAIPEQVKKVYANREKGGGIERENAYAGELNYFKQGCYNQANGKSTKSETYDGDIEKQYANGSYSEVWFKEATVGASTAPNKE